MRRFMGFGWMRLLGASMLAGVVLAGCGGGGSDTPPPQASFTQEDLRHFAGLGVVAEMLTRNNVGPGIAVLGAVLEALSTNTAGAGTTATPPVSCQSGGTSAVTVVKPAAHAGLRSGDQVTLVYAKCSISGGTFDGTARLTVKSTFAAPLTNSFAGMFDADLANFTMTLNGSTVTYAGAVTATTAAVVSNDIFKVQASPMGAGFTASIPSGPNAFRLTYALGTTFDVSGSFSSRFTVAKLDGDIETGIPGATLGLTVSTPTPISGPIPVGTAQFVANAGAINVRPTVVNGIATNGPATATSISGNTVTVSGDTDRDGSLETVFTTTWAGLLAQ